MHFRSPIFDLRSPITRKLNISVTALATSVTKYRSSLECLSLSYSAQNQDFQSSADLGFGDALSEPEEAARNCLDLFHVSVIQGGLMLPAPPGRTTGSGLRLLGTLPWHLQTWRLWSASGTRWSGLASVLAQPARSRPSAALSSLMLGWSWGAAPLSSCPVLPMRTACISRPPSVPSCGARLVLLANVTQLFYSGLLATGFCAPAWPLPC